MTPIASFTTDPAVLVLEDGSRHPGRAYGARGVTLGPLSDIDLTLGAAAVPFALWAIAQQGPSAAGSAGRERPHSAPWGTGCRAGPRWMSLTPRP